MRRATRAALTVVVFLLAFAVVSVCAPIHGSVRFRLNLLAVPLLLLVDPALVPGPALAAGLVMAVLVAGREFGFESHALPSCASTRCADASFPATD